MTPGRGVYIIQIRATGEPIYVGVARDDVERRAQDQVREQGPRSIAARAEVMNDELTFFVLKLPHARLSELAAIEALLIDGIGRRAPGPDGLVGPLVNEDGGTFGGHNRSPEQASAAAKKAWQTMKRSAAAKGAWETRRRNSATQQVLD